MVCLPNGVGVAAELHWICVDCGTMFRKGSKSRVKLKALDVCKAFTDAHMQRGRCLRCRKIREEKRKKEKERKLRRRREKYEVPKV